MIYNYKVYYYDNKMTVDVVNKLLTMITSTSTLSALSSVVFVDKNVF